MKLLTAILTLFAGSPEEAEQNSTEPTTPDTETEEDIQGYTNAFSQLSQAIKANQDPFKDIEPKSFFVISLYKLCRSAPQKVTLDNNRCCRLHFVVPKCYRNCSRS